MVTARRFRRGHGAFKGRGSGPRGIVGRRRGLVGKQALVVFCRVGFVWVWGGCGAGGGWVAAPGCEGYLRRASWGWAGSERVRFFSVSGGSKMASGTAVNAAPSGGPGDVSLEEPKKMTREDWRKKKELEEQRKLGNAPAEVDEEGK